MATSGAFKEAKATEELFIRNFARYDHIVAPSGSCVHHLRNKFTAADDTTERRHIAGDYGLSIREVEAIRLAA